MNLQSNIFSNNGVIHGVIYGQNERIEELNQRYIARQFSDMTLAPNFDPRPVSTKCIILPCIDERHESIQSSHAANIQKDTTQSNGFSKHIDIETGLRNQGIALQHSNQSEYIPASDSDLYRVTIVSRPIEQPYPLLFSNPSYTTTLSSTTSQPIGRELFNNHTRTQLRGLSN
jgi:hypothetical protein